MNYLEHFLTTTFDETTKAVIGSTFAFIAGRRRANKEEESPKETFHRENIDATVRATLEQLAIEGTKPLNPPSLSWADEWSEGAERADEAGIRDLWAKILKEEFLKPGSVSKRALSTLRLFSREDAEFLRRLSAGYVKHEGFTPVAVQVPIPDWEFTISNEDLDQGISLGIFTPLQSGQIRFVFEPGRPNRYTFADGTIVDITGTRLEHDSIVRDLNAFTLTRLGEELCRIPWIQLPDKLVSFFRETIQPHWYTASTDPRLAIGR